MPDIHQESKQGQERRSLEELRRQDAHEPASVFMPAGAPGREGDCAPGVGIASVATSVEEASDASAGVPERDDGRKQIGKLQRVLALEETPGEETPLRQHFLHPQKNNDSGAPYRRLHR